MNKSSYTTSKWRNHDLLNKGVCFFARESPAGRTLELQQQVGTVARPGLIGQPDDPGGSTPGDVEPLSRVDSVRDQNKFILRMRTFVWQIKKIGNGGIVNVRET